MNRLTVVPHFALLPLLASRLWCRLPCFRRLRAGRVVASIWGWSRPVNASPARGYLPNYSEHLSYQSMVSMGLCNHCLLITRLVVLVYCWRWWKKGSLRRLSGTLQFRVLTIVDVNGLLQVSAGRGTRRACTDAWIDAQVAGTERNVLLKNGERRRGTA